MTRIKICGIQEPAGALVAAQAGADYLGFVFVPGRRRRLAPAKSRQIIQTVRSTIGSNGPKLVGLFADQSADEVNGTAEECGLDMVQLCGNESLDYCRQMALPVIKVLHVRENYDRDTVIAELAGRIHELRQQGHLVTLDRYEKGLQGGTGHTFNWGIAREMAHQGCSFLLAGGLRPDNVAQAIKSVRPWGVDVSSGVETGGVKDAPKIRAFISQARLADQELLQH